MTSYEVFVGFGGLQNTDATRTLLGATGIATRSNDATMGLLALLLGTRTLLGTSTPSPKSLRFCQYSLFGVAWQLGTDKLQVHDTKSSHDRLPWHFYHEGH